MIAAAKVILSLDVLQNLLGLQLLPASIEPRAFTDNAYDMVLKLPMSIFPLIEGMGILFLSVVVTILLDSMSKKNRMYFEGPVVMSLFIFVYILFFHQNQIETQLKEVETRLSEGFTPYAERVALFLIGCPLFYYATALFHGTPLLRFFNQAFDKKNIHSAESV